MSAQSNPLHVIADNGRTTPDGLKRELVDFLTHNASPAITATIDHITGNRITITATSPAHIAQLVNATLNPATPANLV